MVFEDADIKSVVTAIGSTWAFHSGQICTAPTRAVVHRSIFDQVVSGLSTFAGYLKVGDPTEKETVVGPLISAAHRQRVLDYIEIRPNRGRDRRGRRSSRPSAHRLLRRAHTDHRHQRHDRGPGGDLRPGGGGHPLRRRGRGDRHRQRLRRSASTTTCSPATPPRAFRVAKQLRAGHVGINTAQRNMDAPFGGFKMSGIGRDGGDYSLEAYSEMQSIIWAG